MNKISVIGGAGFLGTNYCRFLADREIDFEIIDLRKSQRFADRSVIADIRDLDALRRAVTGQVVVHLAAVHRDDVSDRRAYFDVNVTGTDNVARICAEKGIAKIVFTSSVAVYGFAEEGADETAPVNPFNEYGRTKYLAEQKLVAWHEEAADDRALVIVRPTVIFGEGNRGNVHTLLSQINSGRFVMVGSGKNRKSMAYVGNVVAFLDAAVRSDSKCAVFNYVDTPDLDMNTLVEQVRLALLKRAGVGPRLPYGLGLAAGYICDGLARLSGRSLPFSSIRVRKFCATTAFSSAKDQMEGFRAPFTLHQGLQRTLESEFLSPDPGREIFYTE